MLYVITKTLTFFCRITVTFLKFSKYKGLKKQKFRKKDDLYQFLINIIFKESRKRYNIANI